jgi:hypothetical protein
MITTEALTRVAMSTDVVDGLGTGIFTIEEEAHAARNSIQASGEGQAAAGVAEAAVAERSSAGLYCAASSHARRQ